MSTAGTVECVASFNECVGPWAAQGDIRIVENGPWHVIELELKPPINEARAILDILYDRRGKVRFGSLTIPTQTTTSYIAFEINKKSGEVDWTALYPTIEPKEVRKESTLPMEPFTFRDLSYILGIYPDHRTMTLTIDRNQAYSEDPPLLFNASRLAFSFRNQLDPIGLADLTTYYKYTSREKAAVVVPYHYKSFQAVNS